MFTIKVEFEIKTQQSLKDLSKIDKVTEEFQRLLKSVGAQSTFKIISVTGDGEM